LDNKQQQDSEKKRTPGDCQARGGELHAVHLLVQACGSHVHAFLELGPDRKHPAPLAHQTRSPNWRRPRTHPWIWSRAPRAEAYRRCMSALRRCSLRSTFASVVRAI
jgi:hypothetical protein